MDDLLASLNDEQRRVVLHHQGPALVVAGAGSGKTRTVVHRIAYLIAERGVHPAEILAVTFTNKAAQEMRERLEAMIGRAARDLWVATFHAAALRILRVYGSRIGLPSGFPVYDDDDQLSLIKAILTDLGLEARPTAVRSWIDRVKSSMAGSDTTRWVEALPEWVAGLHRERFAEVFGAYQSRLKALGAVDFSDLLLRTIELFQSNPEALRRVQSRARFIHVDEYQDTNPAQYRLTRLLAGEAANLMVVGDPDQSIYAFRSADLRNILRFTEDYPSATVYRLETNYRSSAAILKVANAVIEKNEARLEKVLRPSKSEGEPVRLFAAYDHRDEAEFVASEAKSLLERYRPGEIAVLYRTNAQSRVLEEAFRRENVPAKVVGGVGFFSRKEIKDVLAYARAAVNPRDDVAIKRIINTPPRGLGAKSLEKIESRAKEDGVLFHAALRLAPKILAPRQAHAVRAFIELLDTLAEQAEKLGPRAFFELVLSESGYKQALALEAGGKERLENLEELLRAAGEWEEAQGGTVADFLDEISLTARAEEPGGPEGDAVSLMTLHNAKGLEFPVVFLVGVEEGLLPHRSSSTLEALEEERRLFYVGVTRAMERLYLSYARERETYGRREKTQKSRFIEEIPAGLLQPVHTASAPPPTPKPPRPAAAGDHAAFKGGERVRHPRFGVGVVVAARGEGARAEVTVHFDGVGLKKLLVKYAGLERLPGP